jgi:hypothetical protein
MLFLEGALDLIEIAEEVSRARTVGGASVEGEAALGYY